MNVLDNIDINQIGKGNVLPEKEVKFMLICSRDLEEEELDLLHGYGKILVYDECHVNISLDQLTADIQYIIFDVRKKSHRMAISKEMNNQIYHIVAVIHKWQELDDFIDDANCENCITSFPPKQAFKKDFDKLLLEKKIRKPSCSKNIFRVCFKAINGWQKE